MIFKELENEEGFTAAPLLTLSKQQKLKSLGLNQAIKTRKKKKKIELNLTIENIKKRYLYPYASSIEGMDDSLRPNISDKKGKGNLENINFLETTEFEFPLLEVGTKSDDLVRELQHPLTITVEEISKALRTFDKEFPKTYIPHVDDSGRVIDNVHHPQKKNQPTPSPAAILNTINATAENPKPLVDEDEIPLGVPRPIITLADINAAFAQVSLNRK